MRFSATFAITIIGALASSAEPSPAEADGNAAVRPSPSLEQITVTAKKRRQNVQNVPQTIDVIGGATLNRYSTQQFQNIQLLVSGLQLSDNGGQGQNISLRGITYDPDTTANPAVDVYVNEVPVSQTSSVFQDLYDLDQAEIIRGPQGTLRGRTSPAGAILLDTKRPDMDARHGYVQQSFSDDGQIQTEAAVGVPIVPGKVAIRLAGLFDQNGLYGTKDPLTGQQDFNLQHSARFSAVAKPNDQLDIFIMHQDSNDRTRALFGVSGNGAHGPITPANNISLLGGPNTFYDRTDLTTLEATYRFGQSQIAYVAGYQAVKDEFSNYAEKGGLLGKYNTGSQMLDEGLEQLTQELRIQSSGNAPFGYMAGLYYAHQDANVTVFTPSEILFQPANTALGVVPVANVNANVLIPQLVSDYAIFTDETYRLNDQDSFEGGLRWQFERQYRASSYQVAIPALFGGGTIEQQLVSPRNQKEEYRAWTGLASYTHHFNRNIMLYATYGQSFRPGGVVLGISLPLPESLLLFKPETSYDFEVGVKSQLFSGRLRLNADLYDQAYDGYISRQNNLFTSLGYQSITTNGDATARGAELSSTAILTDAWQMGLNTTFTDAHYANAKLPCNDFAGTGQPNTNGPPRVPSGAISSQCITSASLGSPNWFVSINSEYDVPLGQNLELFARALYSFTPRSRLPLLAVNQDPRSLANLYFGAHAPGGRWEFYTFVKNVFNTVGYTNLFGEQFDSGYLISGAGVAPVNYDTGYASSNIQRPREVGVTLSYKF